MTDLLQGKSERLDMLQFDGNINPGNSGGPVIDTAGILQAVAVAKIRDTQIGFAIPRWKLEQMCIPKLVQIHSFGEVVGEQQNLRVTARLENPALSIEKVTLQARAVPADDALPARLTSGQWPTLEGEVFSCEVPVFRNSIVARLTLPALAVNQKLVCQPIFTLRDGERVVGEQRRIDHAKLAKSESPAPRDYRLLAARKLPRYEVLDDEIGGATVQSLIMPRLPPPRFGTALPVAIFDAQSQCVYVSTVEGIQRINSKLELVAEFRLPPEEAKLRGLSKAGLIVERPGGALLVLDSATLEVKHQIDAPDLHSIAISPALPYGFAPHWHRPIRVVDFETGKVVDEFNVTDCWAKEGGLRAHLLAPALPETFKALTLSDNGQHAYCIDDQCLTRMRVKGTRLLVEEVGPPLGNLSQVAVSPDGRFVCPCKGSYHPPHLEAAKLKLGRVESFVFAAADLRRSAFSLRLNATVPQFDTKHGRIWTARQKIGVHDDAGQLLVEADLNQEIQHIFPLNESGECFIVTTHNLQRVDLNELLSSSPNIK